MFNLLISNDLEAWNGEPFTLELKRCVKEYTDSSIIERYGSLDEASIAKLKRCPCIFAYETGKNGIPKFGRITQITKGRSSVVISYEIQPLPRFITSDDLERLIPRLDIGGFELYRTHWAVKEVNLAMELASLGIDLPEWAKRVSRNLDIETHIFDVGLSFPGESRAYVSQIAILLEQLMGPNTYFYDHNYRSFLARPSLDTFLQDIYRNRSRLIVVFLSADYQNKPWCGLEFRAIREIIMNANHRKIMFIRLDDGEVNGVFQTDGYIDARNHTAEEVAHYIVERFEAL